MIHSSQVQMQHASVKLLDDLNTICGQFLKPNGSFITKCLDENQKIKFSNFKNVQIEKPKSSRSESDEIFYVCQNFRF
jgi:23S rRNA U2552 (ribose-2'-O)-methylase RlmE/FtsJ